MTKSTAGMVRELSEEYDIIMSRAAQIKSAILMLQAIPPPDSRKGRLTVVRPPEKERGVVLGNIPVNPAGKAPYKKKLKQASGKRAYTKKSAFWKKPHPRKKK